MEEELFDILKKIKFLPLSLVDAYRKEASSFGITTSLREESHHTPGQPFQGVLNKIKHSIETLNDKEQEKVLKILRDLTFFSLYLFEFEERNLSIFNVKNYGNIIYRILVAHKITDILKLIPNIYFERINILQKIFLLSHIQFFSLKYIDSLHQDPLFEEVLHSNYLREFLFFSQMKSKKKYLYDTKVVNFASSLQQKFPTAYEFLNHLDSYLHVMKSLVEKGKFSKEESEKNSKKELIQRLIFFLANQRKMVHLLALKEANSAKFMHLSTCLNYTAQYLGSMHKENPLHESRQAILSKFIDFKEPAAFQVQLLAKEDPQKEISFNFLDPLEFDVELENVIKKTKERFPSGIFSLKTHLKHPPESPWKEAYPFLILPETNFQEIEEEYLQSGGLNKELLKKYAHLLIHDTHPALKELRNIFQKSRVISDVKSLEAAGFTRVEEHSNAVMTLIHPQLKEYYVDVVLDGYVGYSEKLRFLHALETLNRLKKQIEQEKLEDFFVVANAWTYLLPINPPPDWWIVEDRKLFILLRENPHELSLKKNTEKWKKIIDQNLFENLFRLALKLGLKLKNQQLRFTKEGKISFSPYSLLDEKKDQFSFFLKRIHPEMASFCLKVIEEIK